MEQRRIVVWITVASLLLAGLVTLWWWSSNGGDAGLHGPSERSELEATVDSLRDVVARQDSMLQRRPGLMDWDVQRFRERGLENPRCQLVDSLLKRSDLIPHESVLGGTMAFRPEAVTILSDRWIFAGFDDGHIAGHMLVEYQVSSDGSISWDVIDSNLQ